MNHFSLLLRKRPTICRRGTEGGWEGEKEGDIGTGRIRGRKRDVISNTLGVITSPPCFNKEGGLKPIRSKFLQYRPNKQHQSVLAHVGTECCRERWAVGGI